MEYLLERIKMKKFEVVELKIVVNKNRDPTYKITHL